MNSTKKLRLSAAATFAAVLLALLLPASASAHPLGNFTINHYNGLTVSATWAHLDHVVDMAELPTVQARQEMDTDHDGQVTDSEASAWAQATCRTAPADLPLTVGGRAAVLEPRALGLTFAPGQAGLQTLRLVCEYVATLPAVGSTASVEFRDDSYPTRQGWHEIVVAGSGAQLAGADAFANGTSDRLRAYPVDAGGGIRAQGSATFSFTPITGAISEPLPMVADAVAFGSAADVIVGISAAPAVVPGGVGDLPSQLTNIIQAGDLSVPALLLAVAFAMALGAFHAATPGHGKTLMAAYLVGTRGTARHAIGLGLTVTFTHTAGVFVLGAIVLVAGAALPSERLLPLLGLVSGVIVTALGVVFLARRISVARHDRQHDHGHEHGHSHDALEHSHGLVRHSHLPSDADPLKRRNLVALGLVGGLVPSASAILILVGSIAAGRPVLGMILTFAFGVGMAAVLVGVGLLLVRARSLIERVPSRQIGRVFAYAPLITALVFVVVGVAITVQSGVQLR
jgi:nickel/cobalt transporter (NicO) family protein